MRIPKSLAVLLLGIVLAVAPLSAIPVDLELLLLVDVSGSVDVAEYGLQKQGYVNAFNNPAIFNLLSGSGIAVAYAEWSGAGEQQLLVPFTQIIDQASSEAFADAIAATSRAFGGQTAPGSAIAFGGLTFVANGFEGTRLVIDISGDGAQNQGIDTLGAAIAANLLGITINGLPILGEGGLQTFYQNSIVTPGGGFLVVANDFDDFGNAVVTKIGREIGGEIPEPSTIVLLVSGIALVRFASARRKQ